MPIRTSAWLFEHVHSHLVYLCNANSKIFLPISLRLLQQWFKHWSTAPSALVFLCGKDGSKHMPVTLYYVQVGILHLTHPRSPSMPYPRWTIIIADHCGSHSSLSETTCLFTRTYCKDIFLYTFAIGSIWALQYHFHHPPHQSHWRSP